MLLARGDFREEVIKMMTSLWFVVFLAIRHFSNFVDNDNDNYIDNLVVLLARGDFREEVIKMMTMVMTSLLSF